MVTIIKDINLISEADKYDVLLVGTNIYGRLSNGWQLDAKLTYPTIHKVNLETRYGDVEKLGKVISVPQTNNQTVCLLYITKSNNFRPDLEKDYLDYDALINCLQYINILFKGKRIASPILGSSKFDGNGDKDTILKIFEDCLTNVDITLYDYEQTSYNEQKLARIKRIMDAKTKSKINGDTSEYHSLVKQKKEYEKKLKLINNLKIFETDNG